MDKRRINYYYNYYYSYYYSCYYNTHAVIFEKDGGFEKETK